MIEARIFVTPGADGYFMARLQYSHATAPGKCAQDAADRIVARYYGPSKKAVFESYDELARKRTFRIEELA